jgi:hypothetical protein
MWHQRRGASRQRARCTRTCQRTLRTWRSTGLPSWRRLTWRAAQAQCVKGSSARAPWQRAVAAAHQDAVALHALHQVERALKRRLPCGAALQSAGSAACAIRIAAARAAATAAALSRALHAARVARAPPLSSTSVLLQRSTSACARKVAMRSGARLRCVCHSASWCAPPAASALAAEGRGRREW